MFGIVGKNDNIYRKILDCFQKHETDNKRSKKPMKCTVSTFKELRGLTDVDADYVMEKFINEEISVSKINQEAKKLKQMKEVQQQVISALALESWDEFCERCVKITMH